MFIRGRISELIKWIVPLELINEIICLPSCLKLWYGPNIALTQTPTCPPLDP